MSARQLPPSKLRCLFVPRIVPPHHHAVRAVPATEQPVAPLADEGPQAARVGAERDLGALRRVMGQRVAKPCGLTGAQLDQILFQNYDAILADIKLLKSKP